MPRPLYVETLVRSGLDGLWDATQTASAHFTAVPRPIPPEGVPPSVKPKREERRE